MVEHFTKGLWWQGVPWLNATRATCLGLADECECAVRTPSGKQLRGEKWESVRVGGSDEDKLDVVFFIAVPTVWVDAAAKVEGRSLIRIIPAHLLPEHQGHRWLQKGNIVRVYILRRHAELVMCLSFDRCLHVCL